MSKENKTLSVENLQQIELPKFNPKPFIGKEAIVDEVELKSKEQVDGKISYYVMYKALVDPVGFNGEPLYATKIVGVQVDSNGVLGWGEGTKMDKFLKYHNIKNPMELRRKTVIVQTQPESTYLTF